jgi:hypothetical protein
MRAYCMTAVAAAALVVSACDAPQSLQAAPSDAQDMTLDVLGETVDGTEPTQKAPLPFQSMMIDAVGETED